MRKLLFVFALLLCSLPASAQEGGVKIFVVTSTAGVKCSPKQPALWVINSGGSAGVYRCSAANTLTLVGDGTGAAINATDGAIPYRSGATAFSDSPLVRAGANTVEQRNSTNAGFNYIFGTYTNGSNYERLKISHEGAAGVFVKVEQAGTGSGRNLFIYGGGSVTLGDGGTNRWQVSSGTGHLVASVDNSYDFGASGATRPRTGYFGTSVVTPKVNFSAAVTPSGTADAQGSTGDLRYDDNFIYVKTSAGWKRAALSTF